jgi:hypothetical protein
VMEVERRTFGKRGIGRKWTSEGCRGLIVFGSGLGWRRSPALIISFCPISTYIGDVHPWETKIVATLSKSSDLHSR